jgi:tetratricopeptide (TPR) repeat protein
VRSALKTGGVTILGAAVLLTLASFDLDRERATPTPELVIYRHAAVDGAPSFPVVERAAAAVREHEGGTEMVAFLTRHVHRFAPDPNNGYFLTLIGDVYLENESAAVARQYYRRALLAFPDVHIRSVSSHRVAVNRLLTIVDDPLERIDYLSYLMSHHAQEIDRGLVSYYLGTAAEAAGRWDEAYRAYRVFMEHPTTRVPGVPDARELTGRRLAFYDSTKRWVVRDLDELVTAIKGALWRQNSAQLLRYQATVNFFTMSWEQEAGDANSEIPSFDIAAFLRRSRVRFADELDLSSNATEAYLRTWGWSHRIPTWYLYFRKVDFPADPEIHGTWEWAGIYFGDAI